MYANLLKSLIDKDYKIVPLKQYCNKKNSSDIDRIVIIRHDIDKKPENALELANIESKLGLKTSYYFRMVKQSFNEDIIKQISDLGHEIGYHYEDLSLAKGNFENAIKLFEENLNKFREICEIKTICMHGSPLSKWDNRSIWKKFDYHDFGIIGEPYFDVDFNDVFYITDTGRRWNGDEVSIRDKVTKSFNQRYKTTQQIINSIILDNFPSKVMMTTHPQRWSDNYLEWLREYFSQNTKNVAKYFLNKIRN